MTNGPKTKKAKTKTNGPKTNGRKATCYYLGCGNPADWHRKAKVDTKHPRDSESEEYVCDDCTPSWRLTGPDAYEPITDKAKARLEALPPEEATS